MKSTFFSFLRRLAVETYQASKFFFEARRICVSTVSVYSFTWVHFMWSSHQKITFSKTNIAPENGKLEDLLSLWVSAYFQEPKPTSFRAGRKFTGSDFSPCHGAPPSARSSVCRTSRATFPWVGLVGIFAACQLCLANKMRRIWKKLSREKSVVWWFWLKRNLALRWHSLDFTIVRLKWHGWILTEDMVSAPVQIFKLFPALRLHSAVESAAKSYPFFHRGASC